MNTLIRHIEYLISRKDCVIIPDLGAILAKDINARIDQDNDMIYPPSRTFTFNSELKHNDGLIVTSIQRAEGISYEAALRKVTSEVESMKSQLKYSGRVTLGRIGTINYDKADDTLTFVADESHTLNIESLWLKPIALQPLHQPESSIIEAPIRKNPIKWMKRMTKAAASIAILATIGFIASTPMPVDNAMLASLMPDLKETSVEELMPQIQEVAPLTVTLPSPTVESVIDVKIAKRNLDEAKDDSYYVIVASLATIEDANKFIEIHKDDKRLRILDGKGYYRIYSAKYDSAIAAFRQSKLESNTYPEAWICQK